MIFDKMVHSGFGGRTSDDLAKGPNSKIPPAVVPLKKQIFVSRHSPAMNECLYARSRRNPLLRAQILCGSLEQVFTETV